MCSKIIHQIWYQGADQIPSNLKANSINIIKYHPDWQYIIWDDSKIQNYFGANILGVYYRLEHLHQKVDFIRYCILYELGGVYIDMDVTILKPLDEIVDKYQDSEAIISNLNLDPVESYLLTSHKEFLNNGVICCPRPKSGFMLSLINHISKNYQCKFYDLNKSICINRTTGPRLFTQLFNQYPNKANITVLDWSFFEPCLVKDLCDIKENTILIHHHDNTWVHSFFTWLGYYYAKYKLLLIILVVISAVYWLSKKIDRKRS
jgi:mannosyltransferase OCH1-like enzyme